MRCPFFDGVLTDFNQRRMGTHGGGLNFQSANRERFRAQIAHASGGGGGIRTHDTRIMIPPL